MAAEIAATTRSRLATWTAAILWTSLVLTASGEAFSADATRGYVFDFWSWLGVARSAAGPYVFWTRKAAHFIEYGILGFLMVRALVLAGVRLPVACGGALLWALAVAIGDEANQAQLPSRTGSARDVAIDLAGATTAIAVTARWLLSRRSA